MSAMLTAGPTMQSDEILLLVCKQLFILFNKVGFCLKNSHINIVHVWSHDCFNKK
jgi:hypothetical protein